MKHVNLMKEVKRLSSAKEQLSNRRLSFISFKTQDGDKRAGKYFHPDEVREILRDARSGELSEREA